MSFSLFWLRKFPVNISFFPLLFLCFLTLSLSYSGIPQCIHNLFWWHPIILRLSSFSFNCLSFCSFACIISNDLSWAHWFSFPVAWSNLVIVFFNSRIPPFLLSYFPPSLPSLCLLFNFSFLLCIAFPIFVLIVCLCSFRAHCSSLRQLFWIPWLAVHWSPFL